MTLGNSTYCGQRINFRNYAIPILKKELTDGLKFSKSAEVIAKSISLKHKLNTLKF